MIPRGVAIINQEVEYRQPLSGQGALLTLGGSQHLFVSFTRGRVVMAVQKLRVRFDCVWRTGLRRPLEEFPRARGIPLALHLPRSQTQVVSSENHPSKDKNGYE
jgi:hypothetical protein